MTTNQTIDGVPREWLERLIDAYACHDNNPHCHLSCDQEAIDELRSLLDGPAVESELSRMTRRCQNAELALKVQTENYEALKAAQPQGQPVPIIRIKVIGDEFSAVALPAFFDQATSLRDGEHDIYAKRPQGEPVALLSWEQIVTLVNEVLGCEAHKWPVQDVGHVMTGINFNSLARIIDRVRAEQPAPVAVVLPERKDRDGFGEFSPHSNGWNACLDEVTRLNTK